MRRDRRRDRRALAARWIPLRFTWDDVEHELHAVLRDIAGAIRGH
jgi:very-short-patch-repair endonuclease